MTLTFGQARFSALRPPQRYRPQRRSTPRRLLRRAARGGREPRHVTPRAALGRGHAPRRQRARTAAAAAGRQRRAGGRATAGCERRRRGPGRGRGAGQDVAVRASAEPAEAGGEADHPKRPGRRHAHPALQHQEGAGAPAGRRGEGPPRPPPVRPSVRPAAPLGPGHPALLPPPPAAPRPSCGARGAGQGGEGRRGQGREGAGGPRALPQGRGGRQYLTAGGPGERRPRGLGHGPLPVSQAAARLPRAAAAGQGFG